MKAHHMLLESTLFLTLSAGARNVCISAHEATSVYCDGGRVYRNQAWPCALI